MKNTERGIDMVKIQKLQSEPFIKVCKEKEIYYESRHVNSPEVAVKVMRDMIDYSSVEVFIVACLDVKNTITAVSIISKGALSSALVEIRAIIQLAMAVNASNLLVCHNHPSGKKEPSREDLEITSRLNDATKLMGIKLLDHLIITDDSYYSFKENEKL